MVENEREIYTNKLDISLYRKRSNAKTCSGVALGTIQKLRHLDEPISPPDLKLLLQEMYRKIKDIEVSERVRFISWRGKSGVRFIQRPSLVECYRWRKTDIGKEPKETKTDITKEEINQELIPLIN